MVSTAFALALFATATVAQVATASLALTLTPSSGPSGTVVRGQTIGSGDVMSARDQRLPLFLIPDVASSDVTNPSDSRLVSLGELVVNDNGDGTASFAIPTVSPGLYVVMVYCQPCAASSAGKAMLPMADLRVSPAMASTDTESSGSMVLPALLLVAAAAAGFVASMRRAPN
jgi:hypothetical protein